MSNNVKNVNIDERVKNMLEGVGLSGSETDYGMPVLKNKEFTIKGIQRIKSENERDDFKSVLFRTSLGFVVPVNQIQVIDNLPITIGGNTAKDVAVAACELEDLGTTFVVKKYSKASGKFGTDDYTPSKWEVEIV